MNLKYYLKSYLKKNRMAERCEPLIKELNISGFGERNYCFANAMKALHSKQNVDKYVLGWLYFTSKTESSPVEHAWVKIGDEYHDPTPIDNKEKLKLRYSPVFELDKKEVKEVIDSLLTSEELEQSKRGEVVSFYPPMIQHVKDFRNA
ncbi:hypothetical protein ACLKMH_12065 [Psychromonas sp. KJ10-10]|uniref:hypothetical protein n=1 Tax=Psychromonas sp. KJ10-10 TaxID=3391823 RepID=UPI0039B4B9D6